MTTETPPRISLCFDQIQIYVPRTLADITRAKKLLQMLEDEIFAEHNPNKASEAINEKKPHISSETQPQDERPGQPIESPSNEVYGVPAPILQVLSTPQKDTNPPSARDQTDLIPKEGSKQEIVPDANSAAFFIPRFTGDKTKEKAYRTIFFFEHEDGRVMISYMQSRIFTTKAVVLALPYPIPRNYPPLQSLDNNKRTAFRFYREYLYKEAKSQEIDSAIRKDEKDKGIYDDILLAGVKDEDEIMSEAAREAEERRMEKLRKAAEVNAGRWKESDMSPRTKELREKFGFRGLEIRDKS